MLASMAPEPNFEPDLHQHRPAGHSSPLGKVFRRVGTGLLMFIALLGNGLKAMFNMILPGLNSQTPRQAGMQARRSQPSPTTWVMLRNIAIAIPL